jgi:hypothetical protein
MKLITDKIDMIEKNHQPLPAADKKDDIMINMVNL